MQHTVVISHDMDYVTQSHSCTFIFQMLNVLPVVSKSWIFDIEVQILVGPLGRHLSWNVAFHIEVRRKGRICEFLSAFLTANDEFPVYFSF